MKNGELLIMNQKVWRMTSTAMSIKQEKEGYLLIPIAEMISIRGSSVSS
jgi:hypothetical protein